MGAHWRPGRLHGGTAIATSIIATLISAVLIGAVLVGAAILVVARWSSSRRADEHAKPSIPMPEPHHAEIIDLTTYEPRTGTTTQPELRSVDLRGAQTWHIGSTHPSLGLHTGRPTEGHQPPGVLNPALTVIDGGGETVDGASHDDAGKPLRVVDADPHTYFELINLMDWAAHRDPTPN